MRWRQHFQQLLNRCGPPTLADISEAAQDLDIELWPITVLEAKDSIKKLMNGEAPGDDDVYAEMLKAKEQEMPQLLQHILQDVWNNEVIPVAWVWGTIIKLPKEGNLS